MDYDSVEWGFLIIVVIVGIWIGNSSGCFSHVHERDVDYNLSASQFSAAYEKNAISAHSKYKGKIVIVSGYVNEIGVDESTPYITFQDAKGLICRFHTYEPPILDSLGSDAVKYSNRNLESLSRWDRVVVKGLVVHKVIEGVVSIKNCVIIKNGE